MIFCFNDDRQKEFLGAGLGKAGVAVRIPLHRRTDSVPVTQVIVIAHADFIAVVDDGGSRQGE